MIESWKANELSVGAIKNRLANIRWLSGKINKPGLVPASNGELKIEKRQYITNQDKFINLGKSILKK